MKKRALTLEERETMIINWFAIRIQHDNEEPASMPTIARGIGLVPASKVTKMLNGLVEKGVLTKSKLEQSGRWTGSCWMLKAGTFQRPRKENKPIKFTACGVVQTELI